MEIITRIDLHSLQYITNHLTQEATDQAKLYGICDIFKQLVGDLRKSNECGLFVHNKIPMACFGVRHLPLGDNLFLIISTDAMENYREFSKVCKKWLSIRQRSIQCVIPEDSKLTLRMVEKWGFKKTKGKQHLDFKSHLMTYTPRI